MINIKKELAENNLILLSIPSKSYSGTLTDVIRQLSKELDLYVTLNNPYNFLVTKLKKEGVNSEKCYIIDTISSSINVKASTKNCTFVTAPNALTELSIAIHKAIKKTSPKVMIFDSLSALLIYLPINSIVEFTQDLVTKLKESNTQAVFPIIKNKEMINHMSMFISKVVEVEE